MKNEIPSEDDELMALVQLGDQDALATLFSKYRRPLHSYFLHMSYDKSKADDLLQNTFLRIMKYAKNYQGGHRFKSWMWAIARNEWSDLHRKGRKERDMPQDATNRYRYDSTPLQKTLAANRKEILHDALQKIDADKREVIVLVKLKELKYREVAELLGEKESNIKIKVFRGMHQLREILPANLEA